MKQLIENAFIDVYGKIYMTEDAVADLLGISNEELKKFTNKSSIQNYANYDGFGYINGKAYYSASAILLVKRIAKNKSNIDKDELNKIFEDEQNKFFRCFENGKNIIKVLNLMKMKILIIMVLLLDY